jgi:hypothetical protein
MGKLTSPVSLAAWETTLEIDSLDHRLSATMSILGVLALIADGHLRAFL